MMKVSGKKLMSLLSAILLMVMLLTGCTQPAANNTAQPQTTETATPISTPGSSPSSVSRLSEILDGKKYAGQFTIRMFALASPNARGTEDAGDMLLLQSPDGVDMLIDTGHTGTAPQVLEYIKKIGVTKLDYVVLSHSHGDHTGGFPAVMDTFPVGRVLVYRHMTRKVGSAKTVMSTLGQKGMELEVIKEGDTFQFGKDIKVEVLSPVDADYEIPDDDYNNQNMVNEESVVLKMTYRDKTFLFPGDMQVGTENRLVGKYGDKINIDFIKAPHHGYNTSSGSTFLQAASPAITFMSHPSLASMDIYNRYKKVNSTVYVTGLDGVLLAVSDGKNIQIITEKDRKGALKP